MKNLIRKHPQLILIILMLPVILPGCQVLPVPTSTGQQATSASTDLPTTAGSTTHTSAGTTTTAPPPTAEPTTTSKPTTTAPTTGASTAPTSKPSPTTSPTSGTKPANLSNVQRSWWYNYPGGTLFQDKPATITTEIRQLISRYDVVWQSPRSGSKIVYLTMDEGYEFGDNTTKILNTAKLKGVPITFFITGNYINNNPAKVVRMVKEGHLVANHTVNHPNLVDLVAQKGKAGLLAELSGLESSFRKLTGQALAKIVRPPSGYYSERVLAYLTEAGYTTAFWSFAYRDWLTAEQPDPEEAKSKILGQLHNGSVLLLHAVSNTNVAILPDLIDEIRARGYVFALLD